MANGGVIENGVKMAGEILLPGASLLLDGEIKSGAGHAIVGLAAWAYLGPVRLLVSANSYSKSVSDQPLYTHLLAMANTVKDTVSNGLAGIKNAAASATSTGASSTEAPADAAASPASA